MRFEQALSANANVTDVDRGPRARDELHATFGGNTASNTTGMFLEIRYVVVGDHIPDGTQARLDTGFKDAACYVRFEPA
jgi:hypothetical protein